MTCSLTHDSFDLSQQVFFDSCMPQYLCANLHFLVFFANGTRGAADGHGGAAGAGRADRALAGDEPEQRGPPAGLRGARPLSLPLLLTLFVSSTFSNGNSHTHGRTVNFHK